MEKRKKSEILSEHLRTKMVFKYISRHLNVPVSTVHNTVKKFTAHAIVDNILKGHPLSYSKYVCKHMGIKAQFKINKDFCNCGSCKITLVEYQNKNIELEMSIIGLL